MEFLVEFELTIPEGHRRPRSNSALAPRLRPLRSWLARGISRGSGGRPSHRGRGRAIGLYRAESEAELDGLLGALALSGWMKTTVTPLEPHPNDPS
jgi:muconolactone D-isomerase